MRLVPNDRPPIATDRLLLRRPVASDAPAIVAVVGDRRVADRLARVPHPYGSDDAAFFLQEVVPAEWVWAITIRGSDALVGAVGLTPAADGTTAELGYWLAPALWGRGIATEAARAVIRYGFDALRLPYLTSGWFESNPASGRVLAKLGFVETGRSMRSSLAAGRDVPSVEVRLSPAQAGSAASG